MWSDMHERRRHLREQRQVPNADCWNKPISELDLQEGRAHGN